MMIVQRVMECGGRMLATPRRAHFISHGFRQFPIAKFQHPTHALREFERVRDHHQRKHLPVLFNSTSRSTKRAAFTRSSAPVGSSASKTFRPGLINARATAARWRSPPES
jgi:hypothetical protein